ncbi:unnamed protein product [Anisakis simplex]|uniref:Galectin n=1 Tax=Anisakis simplex TaxID=6269 RepID=A0A0M3JHU0_ANISI|nr:unnamed protein product [Anisakis simplex]
MGAVVVYHSYVFVIHGVMNANGKDPGQMVRVNGRVYRNRKKTRWIWISHMMENFGCHSMILCVISRKLIFAT